MHACANPEPPTSVAVVAIPVGRYNLTRDDEAQQVLLRVELPKVASVADVVLDVEAKCVKL